MILFQRCTNGEFMAAGEDVVSLFSLYPESNFYPAKEFWVQPEILADFIQRASKAGFEIGFTNKTIYQIVDLVPPKCD